MPSSNASLGRVVLAETGFVAPPGASPRRRLRTLALLACIGLDPGCAPEVETPPGGDDGRSLDVTMSMGAGTPIALSAHEPVRVVRAFTVPADLELGALRSFSVDVTATLGHMSFTRMDGGLSRAVPALTVRLAVRAGDDTALTCELGAKAELSIIGNEDFSAAESDTRRLSATPEMLGAVNGGKFSVCLEAEASVDLNVRLSSLAARIEMASGCEQTELLEGGYRGPYRCTNTCSAEDELGTVTLMLVQAGETAVYWDDSSAIYFGSVCEQAFRFIGGTADYFEAGTLERTEGGAMKTTFWVSSLAPECYGRCTDSLSRVP